MGTQGERVLPMTSECQTRSKIMIEGLELGKRRAVCGVTDNVLGFSFCGTTDWAGRRAPRTWLRDVGGICLGSGPG